MKLKSLLDYRNTAWGVHPDILAILASAARGDLRAGDLPEQLRPAAAQPGIITSTGGVAVISLRGIITPRPSFMSYFFGGGGGLLGFRESLHEAVGNDDITAIILDFDSPGGSTDLISETAAEIRAARAVKPVVAVANTWAASAAYWLASQADELVVTPSGEVGSIGVFLAHEDVSGLEAQMGVKTTLISAGRYKTEGNPYEPLSDEARQALQDKVDAFYALFVADVATGRKTSAAAVTSGFGEGRMVNAADAVTAGMADTVDTLEATIARVVRTPPTARRSALATHPRPPQSEGTPKPNPPAGGEEATARPSQSYVDVMYGATR